jgi:hypothetical protein
MSNHKMTEFDCENCHNPMRDCLCESCVRCGALFGPDHIDPDTGECDDCLSDAQAGCPCDCHTLPPFNCRNWDDRGRACCQQSPNY